MDSVPPLPPPLPSPLDSSVGSGQAKNSSAGKTISKLSNDFTLFFFTTNLRLKPIFVKIVDDTSFSILKQFDKEYKLFFDSQKKTAPNGAAEVLPLFTYRHLLRICDRCRFRCPTRRRRRTTRRRRRIRRA